MICGLPRLIGSNKLNCQISYCSLCSNERAAPTGRDSYRQNIGIHVLSDMFSRAAATEATTVPVYLKPWLTKTNQPIISANGCKLSPF